jgi:hypothetical protein
MMIILRIAGSNSHLGNSKGALGGEFGDCRFGGDEDGLVDVELLGGENKFAKDDGMKEFDGGWGVGLVAVS